MQQNTPQNMHTVDQPAAAASSASFRSWIAMTAVALAYVSLGGILGFVQGGVAPVLRSQGMDLSAMRWVYALYLPFGIAFLWAPWVDSWRWPWLGRRTGWILPMQAIAVLALLAVALQPPVAGAWAGLLVLGLLATTAAATMDVALDALTVELIAPAQRPVAAAAKMGGVSLGAVLGGGVLVALYPQLGWHATITVIGVLMALSALPVLALIGVDRTLTSKAPRQRARIAHMLRKPGMPSRFFRLTLLVCSLLALFNFNRLLLLDMGVSLERIGSVLGTIGPLANVVACALAPVLVHRLPLRHAAGLMVLACVASACVVWLGLALAHPGLAMTGSVLTAASASALYVALGSLILQWASGDQAATDYALLYGLGRFAGTASLMVLPGLIQSVGWPAFQAAIVIGFALSAGYFMRLIPKAAKPASATPSTA